MHAYMHAYLHAYIHMNTVAHAYRHTHAHHTYTQENGKNRALKEALAHLCS